MDPKALLTENLPLVEEIVRFLCRRNGCRAEEAEEFGSLARLKLLEDDYAVLRKFGGRSSLRTYLTVVLQRLLLDHRVQKWGKWRPSAIARRLGETALRLEVLLYREGHPLEEACEILRTNEGLAMRDAELRALAARLPKRQPRRVEGELALEGMSVPASEAVEDSALAFERDAAAQRIAGALARAIAGLSAQDNLVLKMRFADDFGVSEIARALHLEEKPLYRRIERLLGGLRRELEAAGVRAIEVEEILSRGEWPGRGVFDVTEAKTGTASV